MMRISIIIFYFTPDIKLHCTLLLIALMMEAARTSETLVNFYQTTRRYNPEDSHLRTHRRENLKSYFVSCLFLSSFSGFELTAEVMFLRINRIRNQIICELKMLWEKSVMRIEKLHHNTPVQKFYWSFKSIQYFRM
jgi:hypothetical protein